MSNFDKVVTFNKVFGVPVHETVQKKIFTQNPKLVDLRLSLIKEEVKELEEAIQNHDMPEVIDALADILYVVYGAGASFGINLDKAFDIVHSSNMSKICPTEELAQKTVENYKRLFEEGKSPYDSPAYKKEETGLGYIIYNQSTGKVLKNIEDNAVDFTNFE